MTEFRPGRFEILPTIIKNLIIINSLIFLAQYTFLKAGSNYIDIHFSLHTFQSPLFKPWQFVTYMFLHGSWDHLIFNMLALWMIGATLENIWGPKRFLTFYIVCGLGAAFCHMIVLYIQNEHFINEYIRNRMVSPGAMEEYYGRLGAGTVGASGAVFGCLAAFGYLFPNDYVYFYFLLPIKAKWFVLIYAGIELFMGIRNSAGDNVAHIAHLGGALAGFLLVYLWNKTNKRTLY